MSVRGPRAIAELCLRCVGVLVVVNGLAFAVLALGSLLDDPGAGAPATGIYILVVGLLIACVWVALVGFPLGVLTAHLLQRSTRERVHVTVFALVGAVLSVTIFGMLGLLQSTSWFALAAAAEGALGAGGARWWTGRALARRGTWTPEQGAALPWGKIGP